MAILRHRRAPKSTTDPSEAPREVLVIGGGFAGIQVARALARRPVHVTIVDRHNFHTFLPLLYQVATAGLEPADVAYPIRTIFHRAHNVTFRHGRVADVDLAARTATLADKSVLGFDHVVFASGSTANYFGVPGAAAHAFALYTLADARRLRDHLLATLERADASDDPAARTPTFVIVGGGATGVETSGALVELLDVCVRRDRLRIDRAATRVILVDVAPRLLGGFPLAASDYARRTLERRGVEIRLSSSVVEVTAEGVRLDDDETIPCAAVVWAAGITVRGTVADAVAGAQGDGGRLAVAPDLSLEGCACAWAVGDGAAVPTGRGAGLCPQLAPVAIQSGRHCGRQILRVLDGQRTEPFRYRDKGVMATIGRNAAVAKLPGVPLVRGWLGWLAWMGLHLYFLVGFRNRLRVFINWTWRYLDWPSGPRLIMADAESAD